MEKRIIIAGGGTGGHIFPAIAIANALKKADPSIQILFVGAKGKMEMEKVPQAGYKIEGLDIAGFNRSSLIKNAGLPLKLVKSFLQVRRIFRSFRPDAVIGVGGYSSFPVLRYAQAKGISSFIHESNSFAGKSNILLGKKATRIFVATDGMEKFFPPSKLMVTGNPVRPVIAHTATVIREAALKLFGRTGGSTTLLAVGGSLGAKSINEAIAQGLPQLKEAGIQIIWQTGKTEAQRWKDMASGYDNVWVSDFITQMEQAYAAADIVVSRAGAMAIAELCVVGKPVIFVPYPHAAEDHQTSNAKNLVEKEAALLVKDSEASSRLITEVLRLAHDRALRERLEANIKRQGVRSADDVIAQEILKTMG